MEHVKKPGGEKLSRVLECVGLCRREEGGTANPTLGGCRLSCPQESSLLLTPVLQPNPPTISPVPSHIHPHFVTAIELGDNFVIFANGCCAKDGGWREESPGSGIASGWRHLGG